jgi:HSP20 family protein
MSFAICNIGKTIRAEEPPGIFKIRRDNKMLFSHNRDWFWDPWEEFNRTRRTLRGDTSEFPTVNTWLSSDNAIATTEIPGVDPEKIDISVIGKTVTLRGSRTTDDIKDGQTLHRRERWSGEFSRSIELPFNIEADKVEAKFRKGVLYLTLPRAEAEKPRKIEISSN